MDGRQVVPVAIRSSRKEMVGAVKSLPVSLSNATRHAVPIRLMGRPSGSVSLLKTSLTAALAINYLQSDPHPPGISPPLPTVLTRKRSAWSITPSGFKQSSGPSYRSLGPRTFHPLLQSGSHQPHSAIHSGCIRQSHRDGSRQSSA